MTNYEDMLANIPDTPKELQRAKALKDFLVRDELGLVHVKKIKKGLFDDLIKDRGWAAKANNMFNELKKEHDLSVFADLEMLYYRVFHSIKKDILSGVIANTILKLENNPTQAQLQYLTMLEKLDSMIESKHHGTLDKLSIIRDKRMAKEMKVQDEFGRGLSVHFKNIDEKELENAEKEIENWKENIPEDRKKALARLKKDKSK